MQTARDIGNLQTGQDQNYATSFKALAAEALAVGDIVYISGSSGAYIQVSKADNTAAAKMYGSFWIAMHGCPSGEQVRVAKRAVLDLDTSGSAVSRPVYLSTSGDVTLTKPTNGDAPVIIGFVLTVAVAGKVYVAPDEYLNRHTGISNGQVGRVITLPILINNGVGNYDTALPLNEGANLELIRGEVQCQAADAGATAQVFKGATAVTDAAACAVDKALTPFATMDDAQSTFAAGATVRVTVAGGSAAARGLVTLDFLSRT